MGHFSLMVIFSLLVSIVFTFLVHDNPKDQFRLGARIFGGFVVSGLVLGWFLFLFPI